MAQSKEEDDPMYEPKDALGDMLTVTMIMGGAGFTLSAIQTSLARQNIGAMAVFTKTGGTITLFTAMGATYGFTKSAAANLREKDDAWNPTIAGFLAGAIGGLKYRTFPGVLGFGAGLALLQGVFAYTGGKFSGFDKDPQMDQYARKEAMRAVKRRPIQEILDQLGEGRGIYGPGWQERRAARVKEAYGIDVPRS